ncbi:MAG: rhomboid family intramembrane serine protease, partial [Candidatus Brocadiaceae bacterium]
GLRFHDRVSGGSLADGVRKGYRCSSCASHLYECELTPGSGIMVDLCPQCTGMFLDRGELEAVRRHFEEAGAEPLPGRAATSGADEPALIDQDSPTIFALQYLTGLPVETGVTQMLFPPVVTTLIALNVAVLIGAVIFGFQAWVGRLGVIPTQILAGRRLHTLLTSMFMHGGLFHLLGNMYFLYIAGDNVEERLGWWRFLLFYFAGAVVASLAHVAGNPHALEPAVGASGAVSAVMGAYVVLFPRNRFLIRWFYFLWRHVRIEVPAPAYLALWVVVQFLYAIADVPGLAWWAHLGGFACGVVVGLAARAADGRPSE